MIVLKGFSEAILFKPFTKKCSFGLRKSVYTFGKATAFKYLYKALNTRPARLSAHFS